MKGKRIYISLPITGLPEDVQRQRAKAWERYFAKLGYEVVNPFYIYDTMCWRMGHKVYPTYEQIMEEDLAAIPTCTEIFLIDGWTESSGCCREALRAVECGVKILFERTYKLN